MAWEFPWGYNLVDDIKVKEWDGTQYVTRVYDLDEPANNRDEFEMLLHLQEYLKQTYSPPYPGKDGTILGAATEEEVNLDFVWNNNQMWGKFDKSIDEAKKWMFTIQELTPEK